MLKFTLKARWTEFLLIAFFIYQGNWPLALLVFWLGTAIFWIYLNGEQRRACARIYTVSVEGKLNVIMNKLQITPAERAAGAEDYVTQLEPDQRESLERDLRLATSGAAEWLGNGAK